MLKTLHTFKKTFLLCFLSLLSQALVAQTITINSPLTAGNVNSCSPLEVKWTTTGNIYYVNIDYSLDNGISWYSAINSFGNSGSYFFESPSPLLPNTLAIRVKDYASSISATVGGITINLNTFPKLIMSSPIGYGTPLSYDAGSGIYMSWNNTQTQCVKKVRLDLSTNGGVNFPISITGIVNNNGSFYWNSIPNLPSKNCVIKISDPYNAANYALSESFEIKGGSSFVSIVNPGSNSNVAACSQSLISIRGNDPKYYNIYQSADGGSNWVFVSSIYGNSGGGVNSTPFNVPSISGSYLFKLVESTNLSNSIVGPNFQVIPGNPTIKINSPDATTTSNAGDYVYFTWERSIPCIPLVKIEYSSDEGGNWTTLITNQTSNNSYIQLPSTLSGNYLFRISDQSNSTISASVALYVKSSSLSSKGLAIQTIADRGICSGGFNVQWNTTASSNNFNIEYTANDGGNWNTLATNYYQYFGSNPKNFYWNSISTLTGTFKFRISDYVYSTTGISNSFVIATPSIPSISLSGAPSGSSSICNGQYFSWSHNGICSFDIEISTTTGNTFFPIATNINSTSYYWSPPISLAGGNFKSRIVSSGNSGISAAGYNFSLTPPTFAYIYPNSGTILAGSLQNIGWNPSGNNCIPIVKLELSTNGGTNFFAIASTLTNNGSFGYVFPKMAIASLRLKVSDANNPVNSLLGSSFSIIDPNITITSSLGTLSGCNNYSLGFTRSSTDYYEDFIYDYSSDGGVSWLRLTNGPVYSNSTTLSKSLTVPNIETNNAKFRISSATYPSVRVVSNAFIVKNTNTIIGVNPVSANQKFVAGSQQYLSFTAPNSCFSKVKVEYSTDGGGNYKTIADNFYNNSYVYWTVPNEPTTMGLIRISDINSTISGISKQFSIITPPSSITVLGINSTVSGCSALTVKFNYIDGFSNNFNAYYSIDGGSSWNSLEFNFNSYSSPPNSRDFNIPNVNVPTSFKIKIEDSKNNAVFGISNSFTVTPGLSAIKINTPSATSIFASGANNSIAWLNTSPGCIKLNKVEYSLDAGSSWKTIHTSLQNYNTNNNFNWYTPNGIYSTDARIRITDADNPAVSNTSSNFTITSPFINIFYPATGSAIAKNTSINVNYNYGAIPGENYYFFQSLDGGAWTYVNNVGYLNGTNLSSSNRSWTTPNVTTTTSLVLAFANNSTFGSATRIFYTGAFSVVPPTVNTISVTGLSELAGICQGKSITVSFAGTGTFLSGNKFKAELFSSDYGIGNNYQIGEISSTSLTGIIVTTLPSGISGTYYVRVYSSNPFVSFASQLITKSLTLSSNACITANNNNALTTAPGCLGTTPTPGDIAFQTNTTFNGGNVFIAQLSDGNGSFGNPTFLGSVSGVSGVAVGNLVSVNIPNGLPTGTNYRVRVISTNPVSVGLNNGFGFPLNNACLFINALSGSSVCPGSQIQADIYADGAFDPGNKFQIELSNSSGTFSFGSSIIGELADIVGGNNVLVNTTIPSGVTSSSNYKIRVNATNPYSTTLYGGESDPLMVYNNCFGSVSVSSGPRYATKPINVYVTPNISFSSGNMYIAELSDGFGSFANPISVSSILGTGNVTITGNIPAGTPQGNNYYVRVRSTNHASISTNIYLGNISPVEIFVPMTFIRTYCPGAPFITPPITVGSAVNGDNVYKIQISNNGFASFTEVTTVVSSAMGVISIPAFNLPGSGFSSNYYTLRAVSSSPYSASYNVSNSFYIRNTCFDVPNVGTSFCPNDASALYLNGATFDAGNVFSLLLSDENGNFTTARLIGTVAGVGTSFSIPFTIPGFVVNGNNYKVKVASSDFVTESPISTSINIKQACITAPAGFSGTQCSYIPVVTVSSNGFINPGNEYRLVLNNSVIGIVASDNPGIISFYNVTLPSVNTTYSLRVDATDPAVAGPNTSLNITSSCLAAPFVPYGKFCAGAPINFTTYISASGQIYNAGNRFVVELSDASGSFGTPITVFGINATAANFYATVTIPSGMVSGSNYKIRLKSTNTAAVSSSSNAFTIDQVCITPGNLPYGPYIGGSSSISIPVNVSGSVGGGNTFTATLFDYYSNSSLGTIGSSTSNTITGTLPVVLNGGLYYVKITSSNPIATSTNSNYISINPTYLNLNTIAGGSYCLGSSLTGLVFSVAGTINGVNTYNLELSNNYGYFPYYSNVIGTLSDNTVGLKSVNGVLPTNVLGSTNYKLRIRATGNGSLSNEIPLNIGASFFWTGNTSSDWNTISNWSCPLLPNKDIDVVINTSTNYPQVTVTNAMARNLTVNSGASLSIMPNGLLSVYGDITNDGLITSAGAGAVRFDGNNYNSHNVSGSGDLTFGSVSVTGYNYVYFNKVVNVLNDFYNYGYLYSYSTVGISGGLFNYNRFDAYNTINVGGTFYNNNYFNIYNTYISNPYFYVGGDFENNSYYFNSYTSRVVFNGTSQVIRGTIPVYFYDFQVNPTTSLTLNSSMFVYANFINNGSFNGGTNSVTFSSSSYNVPNYILGSGINNFYNIVFNNIYNVYLNSSIRVNADFVNTAGFSPTNYVVSFSGTGVQNISGAGVITFNGIDVSGVTSDLNVASDLKITGSFKNKGKFRSTSKILTFESNATQFIGGTGQTIFGDFVNNNTNSVSGIVLNGNVELQGSIVNNGLFDGTGFIMTTSGSSMQTISGTNILTIGSIENINLVGVDVTQDIVVKGNFSNKGKLRSAGKSVTLSGTQSQIISSEGRTVLTHVVNSNTEIASGVVITGNLEVQGDILNNGVLNASSSTITLSGITSQTISGTNEAILGTVENNNTSGVEVKQDVAISGNFINKGKFKAIKTTTFSSSSTQVVNNQSDATFTNIVNSNANGLSLMGTAAVEGNIVNNGMLSAGSSVISMTGAFVQSITGTSDATLGTLINSNSSGLKINQDITLNGNLINNGNLESTAAITFTGTSQTISGTAVPVLNDVAIAPVSGVFLSKALRLKGNLKNNSSGAGLTTNGNPITFDGVSQQVISGTANTVFADVSIQNAGGLKVESPVSVSGIDLNGGNVNNTSIMPLAITSSANNAIERTSGHIIGAVSRSVNNASGAYLFPVGTDQNYRGATVDFTTAATGSGNITVLHQDADPVLAPNTSEPIPVGIMDASLGTDSIKTLLPMVWKIDPQNVSGGVYDVKLEAKYDLAIVTQADQLRILKRHTSNDPWELVGGQGATTYDNTSKVLSISRTGIAGFSEYAVAGTCSNVSRTSSKPVVSVVANTLESSVQGNNYEWTLEGAVLRSFTTRKISPVKSGKYRVKVILSGCYTDASEAVDFVLDTSTTALGHIDLSLDKIKLFPNPARKQFSIELNTALAGKSFEIEVMNLIGRTIFTKVVSVDSKGLTNAIDVNGLEQGVYFIKVNSGSGSKIVKLIIDK